MTMRSWILRVGTTGILLLVATACSETDKQLLSDIGVTRLFLIDTSLGGQSILDPDSGVQVAHWGVASATLSFENTLIDLVGDELDCVFVDGARSISVADGECASGILIEAGEDDAAGLLLALDSMELRRAEPLDLSLTVDFDGDGVPNDGDGSGSPFNAPCGLNGLTSDCDDNCPLISNPDQADDDGNGIGNTCSIVDVVLGALRDSDGDGVPDASDNCIWIANADQADTMGLSAEPPLATFGLPDGIGDACKEQVATVQITNIVGPINLIQLVGGQSFVTVDFTEALSCEWRNLNCVLHADQIKICSRFDLLGAAAGCP
jgi:hypothetical protein